MKAAVTLSVLLFGSTSLFAAEGLDLVVVIDRSTSMAGDARLGTLLLQMTVDLIARNAASNHVEHRLAVIGFGSSATVDVPFTSIADTALRRRIMTLPSDDRGDTDVLAAFIAADELFRALPADPARRRAIVLLTDGVPYVRGVDMTAYRERLRRFVERELSRQHISIDVLVAGEKHDPALWKGLARSVHAVRRAADSVLAEAHGVIAQLAGTRTAESAASKTQPAVDTLVMPPYLDVVVFDVFRASPGAEVAIFPPGSITPIRAGAGGVEAVTLGQVLATLIVPRPRPGEWRIVKSRRDARVRILSQQFFPRGTLVRPVPSDSLRQYDRVPLAYRVVDDSDRPIEELRGYALSVEISLSKPDGTTALIATERDPSRGRAVFRSVDDAACDVAGRYWTDVRITTTDARARRLEIFRDRWSGFSVAPATRVDCRVSTSEASVWLPVTAQLDCVSGQKPVEMSALTDGSPAALFRAVLSREGQPAGATIDLRYHGRGAYRGKLHGAWSAGAYQLQFIADRSKLRPPYNIRFLPPRLTFIRRTRFEWLLVPLAIAGTVAGFIARRKTRS